MENQLCKWCARLGLEEPIEGSRRALSATRLTGSIRYDLADRYVVLSGRVSGIVGVEVPFLPLSRWLNVAALCILLGLPESRFNWQQVNQIVKVSQSSANIMLSAPRIDL